MREDGLVLHTERVLSVTDQLTTEMELEWCRIRHVFGVESMGDQVIATTEAHWEYRQATITWNLEQVMELSDTELELVVVHELVHVLLAPLWGSLSAPAQGRLDKLNELAAENVTRALYSVWAS